jgi:type IV secretory pathway VirB4 component
VYKEYEKATLKEYYKALEDYEKEETGDMKRSAAYLRQALHLYVHGSMNVFSHETNVNINKRIVVYDIKDMGKNLQTLGMMIVLENLWDKVAKNRAKGVGTRIFVDEMYLLFKSAETARFFFELYKRARKWGGIPTGITQNVGDVLRTADTEAMVQNTNFVLMLSQNPSDSERLSEIFKIPLEMMSYVTRADCGSGLLYADRYGVIPFYNQFPTETDFYRIMSTKFGEDLDKLKAEKGEMVTKAVSLLKEQYENSTAKET